MYRILVTGSRKWTDRNRINDALYALCEEHDLNYEPDEYGNTMPDPSKVRVVHGACPDGADFWCDEWAVANCNMGLVERHPAVWRVDGKFIKSAGHKRNYEMVQLGADICLAFHKGDSPGTASCIKMAEKAGIHTIVFKES